jgi:hypothetical protein
VSVYPLTLVLEGGAHSLAGEGVGSPNSDDGTNTVVHWVYLYLVVHVLCKLQVSLSCTCITHRLINPRLLVVCSFLHNQIRYIPISLLTKEQ